MDVEKQTEFLEWFSQVNSREQIGLLKAAINTITDKQATNRLRNAVNRRKQRLVAIEKAKALVTGRTDTTPSLASVQSSTSDTNANEGRALSAPEGASGGATEKLLPNIIALDAEFVCLKDPLIPTAEKNVAATVSIVNYDGREIYYAEVFHEADTFDTGHPMKWPIDRFADPSKTKPLNIVRNDVLQYFDQSDVIVMCAGGGDLRALQFDFETEAIFEHKVHELQSTFKTFDPIDPKSPVLCKLMGLARIYWKVFGFETEIQTGVHSAKEDAEATMAIYREVDDGRFIVDYNGKAGLDSDDWPQPPTKVREKAETKRRKKLKKKYLY